MPSIEEDDSLSNAHGDFLDVNQMLLLRNGDIVGQTGLNVLNQGFADVSACGLDRWAIAEASLQPRAIGQIPLVFGLLLDHHFKIEELHAGTVGDWGHGATTKYTSKLKAAYSKLKVES